ncbi:FecCD family ABC transporter permease [Photobacterium damselae]|uniref:FecCD family ABC transporter permease n=1 Tax=Photobacterium damselae TaxID=38293 RepID=UPI001F17B333|nr:iron ABC transporter permease [Photobacterium damselae]UKA12778.1 iron ABC transporter permease [Photobacterium damselae subsp. damselae]
MISIMFLSLSYGSVYISFHDVFGYFFSEIEQANRMTQVIISDVRLPRFFLAIMVGAGLAMSGVLLQTATKNDLADPFLFGLSAGASAGAVLVITRFGSIFGQWTLPAAAFVGGIISSISVILLFNFQKDKGVERLILSGLAVSFLFTAITSYLVYTGDQRSASTILFWSMGGLGLARWDNLIFALFGVVVLVVLVILRWRSFDAMLVDEETSNSLGVNVKRIRLIIFITTAIATSTFVSLTGVIGFIGLIVPHLAKPFSGVSHRYLIPLSAFIGAAVLALSDLISRTIIEGQELPVGLVTSAIGGLFVLFFVLKK